MSKCGKGCMPECEYFTTGGCISPFNCMYKEESGYINSATSGKVFYTGGVDMSNAPIDDSASIYEVLNALQAEVEKLKAENAELKERLEKVVEPPCKIGDILYTVTIVFSDGWVGDTILRRNGFSISETEVTEKNIWSICDLIRRGMAFFSKEAAETRLRELQDNGTD